LKIAEQARLLAELTKENTQLKEYNKKLEERIERLEALLASKVDTKSSKKPVFTENYSLDRNKLGSKDSDRKPPRNPPGESRAKPKNISSVIRSRSFHRMLIAASAFTIASSPRGQL